MKKILYTLLIFASATVFGQKSNTVKFAVANNAIGTVNMFEANKQFIQSMHVYKSAATLPQDLKKFSDISDRGLAEIKFKKDFGTLDFLSAGSLNEQYKLPKDQPVMVEGYEIPSDTNIFAEMIKTAEVKDVNGKKMLFISAK
ncbi:hypothetical protein ASG01_03320 [Chryseobacterium sp. Leaf180]|jgi:hypothetical protein|uniref:hypothetical protein n=1 Tax=Chryseobacterium sp. Leaf180 TaxID=1736289 RepID=UPI0006F8EA8C|nr:hypothetical protein [Chryseobacterium sp. Leaf180]KQR94910.1 hypothetical protein ASG01_03320 [Chryseobacterium sp. Leaf180]